MCRRARFDASYGREGDTGELSQGTLRQECTRSQAPQVQQLDHPAGSIADRTSSDIDCTDIAPTLLAYRLMDEDEEEERRRQDEDEDDE
jgi:hypothetical protein